MKLKDGKMKEEYNEASTENSGENATIRSASSTGRKRGFMSKKKLVIILIIVLVLVGGYMAYQRFGRTPEEKAAAETKSLVAKVEKHMILPQDDEPAVFDVKDPTLLASQQAFFAGAEIGDKLLVYSKSAKAIIYSPKRDIIVNVGPVTFDQNTVEGAKKSNQ